MRTPTRADVWRRNGEQVIVTCRARMMGGPLLVVYRPFEPQTYGIVHSVMTEPDFVRMFDWEVPRKGRSIWSYR